MSKSRKKKSSKQGVSGQTLSALALVISMVALGLSVYQFIAPQNAGPQFYILEYDDTIYMERYSAFDYLYELNITYYAQVGDIVVLEFSSEVHVDGGTESCTLWLNFNNNGTYVTSGQIRLSATSDITSNEHMTHTFEASTTGEYYVYIISTCYQEVDNYVRGCLLTVTVY